MMEKMIALQQKRRSKKGGFYAGRANRGSGYSGNSGSTADSGADRLY